MNIRLQQLLAMLVTVGLASPSFAALITTIERDVFQDAVADDAITIETFDSFADDTILTSAGGVTYSVEGGDVIVTSEFLTTSVENGIGSTQNPFNDPNDSRDGGHFFTSVVLIQFSSPVSAFAIDINTFSDVDGAYMAELDSGDTALSLFDTFPLIGASGSATGQFLGFISDTEFTEVLILPLFDQGAEAFTLDTLVYGSAVAVGGPDVMPIGDDDDDDGGGMGGGDMGGDDMGGGTGGVSVPEPGTIGLLMLSAIALLRSRVRTRTPVALRCR